MKKFSLFLLDVIASSCFANSDKPITQVETGSLQGIVEYNMIVFKNIPYAASPVSDLC